MTEETKDETAEKESADLEAFNQAFEETVDDLLDATGLGDPSPEEPSTPQEVAAEAERPSAPEDAGDSDAAPEDPAPQGPQLTAEDQLAYEAALVRLRFLKTPSEMLEGMSPEAVIAWGKHVEEGQQKQQSKIQEQADRIKELESATQTTSDGESPDEGVPTLELDLGDDAFTDLATELDVPETAVRKSFEPLLQRVVEATHQAVKKQLDDLQAAVQQQGAREDQQIVASNIKRLSEYEPALAQDSALQNRLVEKTLTLAKTGGYESAEQAFDDAFRLEIGQFEKAPEPVDTEVRSARRNGTATPSRRQPRQTPMSVEDMEARVFNSVMEDDVAGAEQIANSWRRAQTR